MSAGPKSQGSSPLERWSRLKREAAREKEKTKAPEGPGPAAPAPIAAAPGAPAPPTAGPGHGDSPLPPVESLTIDSDFSAFLQPKVDEALKRQALKQLFRDPHFNVMDGLDIYVGDYSQPDPISPDIVRQMVQGRYIFDPPPTRINAQGFVEDIPAEEVAAAKRDALAAAADIPPDPLADAAPAPSLPAPEDGAGVPSLPAPEDSAAAPASEPPSEPGVDAPSPNAEPSDAARR